MHISDGVFIMSIGNEAPSRRQRNSAEKGKKRERKKRKEEEKKKGGDRAPRDSIEGLPLEGCRN